MESIKVRQHVGQDGILHLDIPVGLTDALSSPSSPDAAVLTVHRANFSRQVCTTRRTSGSSSINKIRLDANDEEVADEAVIARSRIRPDCL